MNAVCALRMARLLRTATLMLALAGVLMLGACGGGDPEPEPDVDTPRVVCPAADPKACL